MRENASLWLLESVLLSPLGESLLTRWGLQSDQLTARGLDALPLASEAKDQQTGEVIYTVFVPTAPNPTTGFVFLIKPANVVELNWSVEDAFKVIKDLNRLIHRGLLLFGLN